MMDIKQCNNCGHEWKIGENTYLDEWGMCNMTCFQESLYASKDFEKSDELYEPMLNEDGLTSVEYYHSLTAGEDRRPCKHCGKTWRAGKNDYFDMTGMCSSQCYQAEVSFPELNDTISHEELMEQLDLDMVSKPTHYIGSNGLEVEDILQQFIPRHEDSYVAHRVASAIEYLLRAPLKNGKQDIEKARKNLDQALQYMEEREADG